MWYHFLYMRTLAAFGLLHSLVPGIRPQPPTTHAYAPIEHLLQPYCPATMKSNDKCMAVGVTNPTCGCNPTSTKPSCSTLSTQCMVGTKRLRARLHILVQHWHALGSLSQQNVSNQLNVVSQQDMSCSVTPLHKARRCGRVHTTTQNLRSRLPGMCPLGCCVPPPEQQLWPSCSDAAQKTCPTTMKNTDYCGTSGTKVQNCVCDSKKPFCNASLKCQVGIEAARLNNLSVCMSFTNG